MRDGTMRRGGLAPLLILLLTLGALALASRGCQWTMPEPEPTPTAEPLVPTVVPALQSPQRPSVQAPVPSSPAERLEGLRHRLGVGVARGRLTDYPYRVLGLGWYLDWRARPDPSPDPEVTYVRMVRMRQGVLRQDTATLTRIARQHPGALWLIGNEPDVAWQDNTTPEAYALAYNQAYRAIKRGDPTAQVAIGGVSQVTPLRLAYLDRILSAYEARFAEPMPVDVWNVHLFILREERDSWGVGIPPGFENVRQGTLWEIADHDRLDLLQRQVLDIRRWLYTRGRGGIPLVVSEYGILMPAAYGFPPERVAAFLRGSFDLFLRLEDPLMGDPDDNDRLVQAWCWYSLADTVYPTGNLFDPETKALTPVGVAFSTYGK